MTAIVLPDIDRSTIEELRKRIPDLTEIDLNLPSRKDVGKTAKQVSKSADETIDRLLGRKRAPVWPWIAAGIGLVAIAGVIAAWFAWFRRPSWEAQSEPWTATYEAEEVTTTPLETTLGGGTSTLDDVSASVGSKTRGSAAATLESAGSAPYPIEEA